MTWAVSAMANKDFSYSQGISFLVITSKLTSKAQTTIPQPVRVALRLKTGDELAYTVEGDRVILKKATSRQLDDPFIAFVEWASDNDRRAYADL